MFFCFCHLDKIRKLQLPEIKLNQEKEAVLIEFRYFPHIEFTIRNTIYKLGSEWSYTVVCGTGNFQLVKQICNNISKNIKIMVYDYENVSWMDYSIFLVDKRLWQKFKGNKILIFQEDAFIFNSNIDEFLKYDYIGAVCPWHGILSVGNGGLSLRTKDIMIEVIERTVETNAKILSSIVFEDIFFTDYMKSLKLGTIAPLSEAEKFSFERIYKNIETFGCHQPWRAMNNWEDYLYQKLLKDL